MKWKSIHSFLQQERARAAAGTPAQGSSTQRTAAKLLAWFFALMLVFTVLSRAANGLTVAEVTAETYTSGPVRKELSASGKVEAMGRHPMEAIQGLTIVKWYVSAGDTVKKGDPLVEFDPEDTKAQLEKLRNELADLKAKQSVTDTSGKVSLATAKQAVEDAQKKLLTAEQDAVEKANDAQTDLDKAKAEAQKAQTEYSKVYQKTSENRVKDAEAALKDAQQSYQDAKTAYEKADATSKRTVDDARIALEEAKDIGIEEDIEAAKKALARAKEDRWYLLDEAEKSTNRAKERQDDAQAKLDQAKDSSTLEDEPDVKAAKNAVTAAQEDVTAKERALADAKRALPTARDDAQAALDAARLQYESALAGGAQTDASLNAGEWEIQQKEKELASLQSLEAGNYLLAAPEDGVVMEVNGEAGAQTDGKSPVVLSTNQEGYRFIAEISQEESKWLSIGDQVKLNLRRNGEQKDLEGTVQSIGFENENGLYPVTVALPEGSYLSGETSKMESEKDSKRYNMRLPLTALRSDSKGDFIYVVRERDSVLGRETYIEHVGIDVQDKDGTIMALNASLLPDDKVVTGSNRPLEAGDRVRLEQP
ncbi:HlyD family efflux transporter periplasmic adaptor subunit [Clostridium sp. D33t1_170424_F3]|uniref:HlyD family efflux transporter periplasmic adaptor subunit n=1 Tax=Clostridium sp. D33t1_170424_F3 TaxID=2787099 RepID=UPI0018AC26F3|nr:HlyD family efflux transporter periplasmic adaptor subunit [Clostridium sp. D33t1_170424_F3]